MRGVRHRADVIEAYSGLGVGRNMHRRTFQLRAIERLTPLGGSVPRQTGQFDASIADLGNRGQGPVKIPIEIVADRVELQSDG